MKYLLQGAKQYDLFLHNFKKYIDEACSEDIVSKTNI